ncbi:unnamed protein product [Mortierella alpina]
MSCHWYPAADAVATLHSSHHSYSSHGDLVQHDHHDEWMRFLQLESRSMVSSTSYPIQPYSSSPSSSSSPHSSRAAAITAVALQAQARARHSSQNQPLSTWSNPSSEQHPTAAYPWPSKSSLRPHNQRSYSISSSTSSGSSGSSWSSFSSSSVYESDTEPDSDAMSAPSGPRNKILPPPTLSPILVSSTSTAALYVSAAPPKNRSTCSMSSCSDDSGSISGFSDTDTEDDALSDAWPTMDKILFKNDDSISSAEGASASPLSELPPPPSMLLSMQQQHHCCDDVVSMTATGRKYLALSASIWGPGWHQVEPLPPSFIKTLEQSELEAQAQAQALAQEKAALVPSNPKAKARKAKQQAKAAAAAAAAAAEAAAASESDLVAATTAESSTGANTGSAAVSSTNPAGSCMTTLCSTRLPRSLQFVD